MFLYKSNLLNKAAIVPTAKGITPINIFFIKFIISPLNNMYDIFKTIHIYILFDIIHSKWGLLMWKIGNVEIKNQIVLAPMAGISNTSYRKIIKEMGAGLIYAEMVSDKAICYSNDKTFDLLKMSEKERPISQQIFGSDKESFVEAAKPEIANELYEYFIKECKKENVKVEHGIFGADMKVELLNDGPVTIVIESRKKDV